MQQAGVPTPQNIRGRHFGVNNETEHTQCLSHHQRSRNPFSGDGADDEIKLSFVSFEDIVEVAGELASRTVTHRELQKLSGWECIREQRILNLGSQLGVFFEEWAQAVALARS